MGSIDNLFIFLSEKESLIQNDVDKLVLAGIVDIDDITTGNSLLVCISRDYFDVPNPTPAIRIRDQLANVFCPKWLISVTKYHGLLPIMSRPASEIPNVYIITENEEIYDNLDYYLHLQKFEGRYRMLLSEAPEGFQPIESQIRRDDIVDAGYLITDIMREAGYDTIDQQEQVPGFVLQCMDDWITRILDLHDVSPRIAKHPDLPPMVPPENETQRQYLTRLIGNPLREPGPYIGEDIRVCLIESAAVRRDIYNLSADMLEKIAE